MRKRVGQGMGEEWRGGFSGTPRPGRSMLPVFQQAIIPLALLAVLVLAAGCGNSEQEAAAPPPRPAMPVRIAQVVVRDLTRRAIYTGSVEPTRVARMASPAEGPIVECAVREGDRVTRGQLLVRVGRSGVAESNLAATREDLERQRADFQRVERLVKSGALPGEQLEIARAALRRAEAQVAAAETSAGDYDIHAPWDGVVSDVFVAEGNYVAPRSALVDLFDPTSLRVRFAVPERESRRIETGASAPVTLDAFPGKIFEARIERIYPRLDPKTRTLTVEADPMTDAPLFAGMFARIETPLETIPDAVVVPIGAIVALPDGSLAVFVAQDGKAHRRLVRPGLEAGGYSQIIEGVAPGESVVVQGQESLRDGALIRVLGAPPAVGNPQPTGGAPRS